MSNKTKLPEKEKTDEPGDRDPLRLTVDGLVYGLDREPLKSGRKVVVTVRLADAPDAPPLMDRADLYSFRSRHALSALVAAHFGRQTGDVMGHVACLLDQVERASTRETLARAVEPLTAERRAAAEKLLSAVDLLDQAERAMAELGYVGEATNKKLVFLVAVSRLMGKPLSAILFAASGAGKSELLDTLARLLPPESVEFLSRITPSALFYAGEEALKHKVVVVDEQAGAADADHAIRTLQTKGLLRLAVPVKGKTQAFTARGPIALLSGTTRSDLNPENLSRCLELALDDGPAQTKLVQEAQRRAWEGRASTQVDVTLWQDVQRLLEPSEVVIPFASQLEYPARTTRDRRDNAKLLTLVAAHALLHQRRRERDRAGRLVALVEDYAAIYSLVQQAVVPRVEGLSAKAADLYRRLVEDGQPVSRRGVMSILGTSYMSAKRLLDELVAQELVRRAPGDEWPRRYRVVDRSLVGPGSGLTPPDALRRRR